jgi:hypothetical protein
MTFDDDVTGRDAAKRATDPAWAAVVVQAVARMVSDGRRFRCYNLLCQFGCLEPVRPAHRGPMLARAARSVYRRWRRARQ